MTLSRMPLVLIMAGALAFFLGYRTLGLILCAVGGLLFALGRGKGGAGADES